MKLRRFKISEKLPHISQAAFETYLTEKLSFARINEPTSIGSELLAPKLKPTMVMTVFRYEWGVIVQRADDVIIFCEDSIWEVIAENLDIRGEVDTTPFGEWFSKTLE